MQLYRIMCIYMGVGTLLKGGYAQQVQVSPTAAHG